jgi:Tol biopolymer transport system component
MKTTILLFLCSTLFSQNLEICLETKQRTKTVYLAEFKGETSIYEKKLEKLFTAALKFNEELSFCTPSNTSEFWAHHKDISMALNPERWHLRGVEYLCIATFKNQRLECTLFEVASNEVYTLSTHRLSKIESNDEACILSLVNRVCEKITHKPSSAARKILFCHKQALYTMNFDGSNIQKLESGHNECTTPASAGKSGHYLFTSFDEGQSKIMLASAGEKTKPIIKLRGNQMLAAVSSKTNCIAYICDAASRADLYIQPFNASVGAFKKPIQLFAKNSTVQASPTFHPSGTKLAFVSDMSGTTDIYLVDLLQNKGNKSLPKLTQPILGTKNNSSPCYSPCGAKLAYLSKASGVRQLFIYDFKANTSSQITFDKQNKEAPSFSPCGQYLLYNTSSTEHNIFIIGLESKVPIQLTNIGESQYALFLD